MPVHANSATTIDFQTQALQDWLVLPFSYRKQTEVQRRKSDLFKVKWPLWRKAKSGNQTTCSRLNNFHVEMSKVEVKSLGSMLHRCFL